MVAKMVLVRVNVLVWRMVVVTTDADAPEPMVKVTVVSSTLVLTSRASMDVTVPVDMLQSDQVASLVMEAAATSEVSLVVDVEDVQSDQSDQAVTLVVVVVMLAGLWNRLIACR